MSHITTFQQAEEFLNTFIRPVDYEKARSVKGKGESVNPLERMRYLLLLLNNPQEKFPSVVISGTSGKGSTTHMIASVFIHAGYKTGMTISPHVENIRERFQINGGKISEKDFVQLLHEIIPLIKKITQSTYGPPSYFEIVLAMIFRYFAREKIDIAVVEVGLEGKFDGTNVLNPLVFVLTNISLDHTQILGNTVEEIAKEATARIHGGIVITGVTQPSIMSIVQKKCKKTGAKLLRLHKDFAYEIKKERVGEELFHYSSSEQNIKNILLSLTGSYQVENASLAIEALQQVKQFGYIVSEKQIRNCFNTITIPGRFEILRWKIDSGELTIILDGAHNPAKMKAFLGALSKQYPNKKYIFIVAFSKGHHMEKMLAEIENIADTLILTKYRATTDMGIDRSEEVTGIKNKRIECILGENPEEAMKKGLEIASVDTSSILVVTGSMYLVGSLMKLLPAEPL